MDVEVDPSAVAFLETGSTAEAAAFVSSYLSGVAALTSVAEEHISIAFRINGGDPVPAANFLRRRRLQISNVVVVTTVLVSTQTAADTLRSDMDDLSTAQATEAFGVQVLGMAAVVTTVTVYPPPSPAPSPPTTDGISLDAGAQPLTEDDDDGEDRRRIIAAIAVGVAVILLVLAICMRYTFFHTPQSKPATTTVAAPVQVQMASVTATSASGDKADHI